MAQSNQFNNQGMNFINNQNNNPFNMAQPFNNQNIGNN
jgi:hypothetical protein